MPLKLIKEDITKLSCDAIVNAANQTLLGGGGVDGAIHRAAGKGLLFECMKLGGCRTGEAKVTKGYGLPSRFVIHTVGPKWRGGADGEEEKLRSCYRSALSIAKERGFESIAFPLISSGAYGYPKDQALKVAVDEITAFLDDNDMLVYIAVCDKADYRISEKLFDDISSFIDVKYTAERFVESDRADRPSEKSVCAGFQGKMPRKSSVCFEDTAEPVRLNSVPQIKKASLDDILKTIDESFSEMLLRKIDEKGMTDAECYKKANIDRKLFSKIRSDRTYRPSKTTAIAFAIALELSLEETKDMLMKAGFALSHSNKFDIIIEYFITNGNYNVFEINEALFAFDQVLLGA
ncbi:MAG: macro domain-containing protein [Oscillospiraceae bacterium]|nr:macro domain-containing protein [Oscillospiraceae bacterium]